MAQEPATLRRERILQDHHGAYILGGPAGRNRLAWAACLAAAVAAASCIPAAWDG